MLFRPGGKREFIWSFKNLTESSPVANAKMSEVALSNKSCNHVLICKYLNVSKETDNNSNR